MRRPHRRGRPGPTSLHPRTSRTAPGGLRPRSFTEVFPWRQLERPLQSSFLTALLRIDSRGTWAMQREGLQRLRAAAMRPLDVLMPQPSPDAPSSMPKELETSPGRSERVVGVASRCWPLPPRDVCLARMPSRRSRSTEFSLLARCCTGASDLQTLPVKFAGRRLGNLYPRTMPMPPGSSRNQKSRSVLARTRLLEPSGPRQSR